MSNLRLYIFSLILLIPVVYPASRMYTQGTKYENQEYIDLFRVPYDFISSLFSPGSTKSRISFPFIDDNYGNYWISPEEGTKVKDPSTGVTYNSLKVNVTITFTKKVFIKNMIYQSFSAGTKSIGYPEELNVYYSLQTGSNAKFTLADNIKTSATTQKVVFTFTKILECYQICLEWKKINSITDLSYKNKATAKEIMFLFPETQNINSTLLSIYDKNDYRQLTLSQSFKNYKNQNLLNTDLVKYGYNDYMKDYIKRFFAILKGELKYDPKREFTTSEDYNKSNYIEQRGDVQDYARNVLKMAWAGTNRQSTGIYGRANEKITIYVKSSKINDPLPQIRFTQYLGRRNWLGKINNLKVGKQVLVVDNFTLDDNLEFPTFPGGPAYLINPYTMETQGEIYVYVEGGTLFPIYNGRTNKTEYMQNLIECINLNKKNNLTYFDITELSTSKAMLTVRASDAYRIYSNNKITPLETINGWDNFLRKLYKFDGIQFSIIQNYFDMRNEYIKIHYRFAQPYALAYATVEHVGFHTERYIEQAINFNIKQIGWGFAHETGHMMDIYERVASETSNNMISKYYDAVLCGNNTVGINDHQKNKIKYLTPDNVDNRLRGCSDSNKTNCQGYFKNIKLNFLIWWDLESVHHGYWGELDNMYRFNNTFPSGITKEEKMVYFSSIIFGVDLGYYFTRWGLSLNSNNKFDEKNVSSVYTNLMNQAVANSQISKTALKKKYWYVDNDQYNFKNITRCYTSNSVFQIEKVVKQGTNKYVITLPKTNCLSHLGFEIYETNKLIGFTYEYTYTDETTYSSGYTPKYKIVAYDRLLFSSKESGYKSFTNSVSLKMLNLNHILFE